MRSSGRLHRVLAYSDSGSAGDKVPSGAPSTTRDDSVAVSAALAPYPPAPEDAALGQRQVQRIKNLKLQLLTLLCSLDRGLAADAAAAAEVNAVCGMLEGLVGTLSALQPPRLAAGSSSSAPVSPFASNASDTHRTTAPGPTDPMHGSGTRRQRAHSAHSHPADGPSTSAAPARAPRPPVDLLAGTWRLVYSSGFNSRSLGGRRPGPPAGLLPTTLGQVYQRICADTGKLDNIVELLLGSVVPDVGSILDSIFPPSHAAGASSNAAGGTVPETPRLRLTLRHDYALPASTSVRITFEETFVRAVGVSLPLVGAGLPEVLLPSLPDALKPPKDLRSATFEVVFLDSTMRVTRGDRGELRIYTRCKDPDAPAATPSEQLQWMESVDDA